MTMCRVLNVARAGFYAWLHNPVSARDKDNQRLLTLIFDYIEVFYNRARRHNHLGGVSPDAFEQASS